MVYFNRIQNREQIDFVQVCLRFRNFRLPIIVPVYHTSPQRLQMQYVRLGMILPPGM